MNPEIAFGLCDLGLGFPEQGSVSLVELETLQNRHGQKVERNTSFRTDQSLGYFTDLAGKYQKIVLPEEVVAFRTGRER